MREVYVVVLMYWSVRVELQTLESGHWEHSWLQVIMNFSETDYKSCIENVELYDVNSASVPLWNYYFKERYCWVV